MAMLSAGEIAVIRAEIERLERRQGMRRGGIRERIEAWIEEEIEEERGRERFRRSLNNQNTSNDKSDQYRAVQSGGPAPTAML